MLSMGRDVNDTLKQNKEIFRIMKQKQCRSEWQTDRSRLGDTFGCPHG
jgi:hypothetical protein